jgi:hypothetical protein
MTQQYRFTNPPQALRKTTLDNIILVPASALPFKAQYQKLANSLPKGSVLLGHSVKNRGQQKLLETVGTFFQKRGHRVTMFSTEGIFI